MVPVPEVKCHAGCSSGVVVLVGQCWRAGAQCLGGLICDGQDNMCGKLAFFSPCFLFVYACNGTFQRSSGMQGAVHWQVMCFLWDNAGVQVLSVRGGLVCDG